MVALTMLGREDVFCFSPLISQLLDAELMACC